MLSTGAYGISIQPLQFKKSNFLKLNKFDGDSLIVNTNPLCTHIFTYIFQLKCLAFLKPLLNCACWRGTSLLLWFTDRLASSSWDTSPLGWIEVLVLKSWSTQWKSLYIVLVTSSYLRRTCFFSQNVECKEKSHFTSRQNWSICNQCCRQPCNCPSSGIQGKYKNWFSEYLLSNFFTFFLPKILLKIK